MRSPAVALAALLVLSNHAKADQWRGGGDTAQITFEESRQDGQLVGCNVGFTQMVYDDVGNHGAPIGVRGLLSLIKLNDKRVLFFLKMAGLEMTGPNKDTAAAFFSPTLAYVSADGYSSAHRESLKTACDGPGYCAGFFGLDDILHLSTIAGSTGCVYEFRPTCADEFWPTSR